MTVAVLEVKTLEDLLAADVETRRLSDYRPGDVAGEVTTEAPGAWRNRSRVRKRMSEPTDSHAVGAMATITGSIGPMDGGPLGAVFGYFVRWDDMPGVPCFVVGTKLELAS